MKILMLYTPSSDLDERVTLNFIRTVQVRLRRERRRFPKASPEGSSAFPRRC